MDTRLLVWWGEHATLEMLERELERVPNANPEAHHVAFLEPHGERRAVLIVHWSAAERLESVSDGGFVNAVLDLG
jgi:hypothetical protein